jgi:DNA-directed RNA polymerase specialized sigma24 family protein
MMHEASDRTGTAAADLYWLAYLLTGSPDTSIDIAAEASASRDGASSSDGERQFFVGWMKAWSRRIVLSKALAAVREELAESARRTESTRGQRWPETVRGWSLPANTNKAQLEEALMKIDVFPRAALLLTIFERLPLVDAAILLDADAKLVRKAQEVGLRELTANLAGRVDRPVRRFCPILAFAPGTN